MYVYTAYGLRLTSEIECPGFNPAREGGDACIARGTVPVELAPPIIRGPTYQATRAAVLVTIPRVARYLVAEGRAITVDEDPAADPDSLRLFLMGATLGILLLQRGRFVLHASAVAGERGAVLLAGGSGRGKSTLAAALIRRGYALVSDDISAVTIDSSLEPLVHPAFSRCKLLPDSVEALGLDPSTLARVRPGVPKYAMEANGAFVAGPAPVRAIFVLDYGSANGVELRPFTGQARLAALRANVSSRRLAALLRFDLNQFRDAALVAARAPVIRISRPRGLEWVDAVTDRIEEALR